MSINFKIAVMTVQFRRIFTFESRLIFMMVTDFKVNADVTNCINDNPWALLA